MLRENIKVKINIILVSIGFFLAFSAFMIASQASQIILEDARAESKGKFTGSGFVSLSLIYFSFAFFNFFVPAVINFLGPTYGMALGSVPYALYVVSFIYPMDWSLYLSAVLVGAGGGLVWTGQVMYINEWSTEENMNTHFSIFYGIYEANSVVGGLVYYFVLNKKDHIDEATRFKIFVPFSILILTSSVLFACLPRKKVQTLTITESNMESSTSDMIPDVASQKDKMTTRESLILIFKMMREPLTYNFIVSGIYTGIIISFNSGVYQTCLGHMQMLTEYPKAVIGLTSIMIGIGGLLASTFDVIAKRMGNNTVMILTLVLTEVAFLLMFLFIPSEASRVSTSSIGYIQPNVYLALFCGCLLGVIDIIWNVQVSGLINKIYEKKQVSAIFAINMMIQSLGAATAFMYGSHLDFQWQMLILTIFSFVNHFLLARIETNRILQNKADNGVSFKNDQLQYT